MKTKVLLMEIASCFLGLCLSVSFLSTSFGASPDDFDILGVRLGMALDEVVRVKPEFRGHFYNNKNYKKENHPTEFRGCAGYQCGMNADWQMNVEVAGEPYGKGVFEIAYEKHLKEEVDRTTFINELRQQLEKKYGKPSREKMSFPTKPNPDYFACWGGGCSGIREDRLIYFDIESMLSNELWLSTSRSHGYWLEIPNDKYLLVFSTLLPGLRQGSVKFLLFDTSPERVRKAEQERRSAEGARRKIPF